VIRNQGLLKNEVKTFRLDTETMREQFEDRFIKNKNKDFDVIEEGDLDA